MPLKLEAFNSFFPLVLKRDCMNVYNHMGFMQILRACRYFLGGQTDTIKG